MLFVKMRLQLYMPMYSDKSFDEYEKTVCWTWSNDI